MSKPDKRFDRHGWKTCPICARCCAWGVDSSISFAPPAPGCRNGSYSISTTPSTPCMAASSFACPTHYDEYGFQPIVVFDGDGRFVTAMLRPAKRPKGKEIAKFLRRLLRAIRTNWPATQILIRADSHYFCPEVIDFCWANGLDFILGVAPNKS